VVLALLLALPAADGTLGPTAASRGFVAYLADPYAGGPWTPLDPLTLEDIAGPPLIDLPTSRTYDTPYLSSVSRDGSTIVVTDFRKDADPRITLFDGRSGAVRAHLRTHDDALPIAVSDDGAIVYVRSLMTTSLIETSTGRIQEVWKAAGVCCIGSPAGPRTYRVAPDMTGTADQRPTIVSIFDAASGDTVGRIDLPDVLTGPSAFDAVAGGVPTLRPGRALDGDGGRLAIHAADRELLVIIDTHSLEVTRLQLHRSSTMWDLIRPLVAEAKELNDVLEWRVMFVPDGRHVLALGQSLDRREGGEWKALGLRLIDTTDGRIVAETRPPGFVSEWILSPDGTSLYLTLFEQPIWGTDPRWELQRLDVPTLELRSRRWIPGYRQPMFVAAP
jgi:hypothetical protein